MGGGLRLTTPAVITLVAYLILAVLVLMPVDMQTWDEARGKYVRYEYDAAQRLLVLLLLALPLVVGVYAVNCFVVGRCFALSWIVAIITIVWAAAVSVAAIANRSFYLEDVLW